MGNLNEYLDWRGDLSFAERPFNDLDNLVLCQLSYIDMRKAFQTDSGRCPVTNNSVVQEAEASTHGMSPKNNKTDRNQKLSLREVVQILDDADDLHILLADGVEKHDYYAAFVRHAASTKRFGNMLLYNYEDIYSRNAQIQFCAVTFQIDAKTDYIAFRGTDDSIIGWKEDFMISFEKIPAQDAALGYVRKSLIRYPDHRYYIGGHSKGANLALYAAAQLSPRQQSQVIHIYVNDGPGLCSDVLDTSIIRSVDAKTTKIVPEYDIIGKIFEMPITDNRIVRSSDVGINQHGILTWQLKDGGLDTVPENAPGSQWIGRVLDGWIGGVTPADRKTFIDDLFDTMAAGGTDTFYELQQLGPEGFEKILSKVSNISRVSISVGAALPLTAAVGPENAQKTQSHFARFRDLLENNPVARAVLLMAGGLFFMLVPNSALPLTIAIVLAAAVVTMVGYTIHELWKNRWNLAAVQTQAYISIASVVIYFMLVVKEGALMLISNLAYGILFLILAYHIIQRARTLPRRTPRWYGSIGESALLIIMALFMLTAPAGTIRTFTFWCGAIFLADGLVHLGLYLRGQTQQIK